MTQPKKTPTGRALTHDVVPRRVRLNFAGVPRHWFGGSPVATHLVNGVCLLFPAGERFFIRSVRAYADRIDDPLLRNQVRGFMGQEALHGLEHERTFVMLEAQGFEIRPFLAMFERIAFGAIEPASPRALRLAVTVAAEHFTATLAHRALTADLLRSAHPTMQSLLQWHAAEEIEHKAVAFDVFQAVDGRYWVRIAGLGLATALLAGFWAAAAASLLFQDARMQSSEPSGDTDRPRAQRPSLLKLLRRVNLLPPLLEYLRPGFHPSDRDDLHLAREHLAGLEPGAPG